MKLKNSVIDYLILSESARNNIRDFKISDPVIYTDHAPMHIKFSNDAQKNAKYRPTRELYTSERKKFLTDGQSSMHPGLKRINSLRVVRCLMKK